MSARPGHYARKLEHLVLERLREEPALLLQGPRSVGKSTLLQAIASANAVPVFDLDEPATRDAVRLDPSLYASGSRPVLIDEYQKVPVVLDAIKAELNQSSAPGQFVLTGSTRYDALPTIAQALTGRLHRLTAHPLTQAELEGRDTNIVTTLFDTPQELRARAPSKTTREDYIHRIVRGGFPLALARSTVASRNRWFDDYLSLTLERDAREIRELHRSSRLPRLLERLAGQTGQVLNVSKAGQAAGLEANTASEYVRVLEALFLLHQLPAWGKTLTSRSTKSPKIHVLDSGVAARLLRLSEEKLASRDATALSELGHLLETFVVNEVLRHASWLDASFTVGHWRTHDGDEVDLVLERDDGRIIAIEVKATTRIGDEAFRALRKLRQALDERFFAGVVLHLGGRALRTKDALYAAPVDVLWR
ncbi:MAG: ATP-binding protein [Trueperaceae bacterium]